MYWSNTTKSKCLATISVAQAKAIGVYNRRSPSSQSKEITTSPSGPIHGPSLSPYGHPRTAVPQYGRRYHREGTIMNKLSMIGIVGGAALLAAVPLSPQWSQVGPAVPLL